MTKMTPPLLRRALTPACALTLAVGLAACGGGADDPSPSRTTTSPTSSSTTPGTSTTSPGSTTPGSSSSTSSTSTGRTVVITVTGSTVSPKPATVSLAVGERLTLTVTSDHADHLHLHGFDIEQELKPGVPVSVTVTGKQPGVYEVETHHPELRLLKIAVR